MVEKLPAGPEPVPIKAELTRAGECLSRLIDLQLTYNFPRSDDPAKFSAYLKDPSTAAATSLPPFTHEEMKYAGGFHESVGEYHRLLASVAARAASIPGDAAETFRNQVAYMDDVRTLREVVQRINPVRSRQIAAGPTRNPPGPFPEQVSFLQFLYSRSYLIPPVRSVDRRNPGLADQAQVQVSKLKDLIEEDSAFQTPWFVAGCRNEVPPGACYVGHAQICGRDSYAWVLPGDLATLGRFALIVQTLAPIEKQDTFAGATSRGAAFSPGLH